MNCIGIRKIQSISLDDVTVYKYSHSEVQSSAILFCNVIGKAKD